MASMPTIQLLRVMLACFLVVLACAPAPCLADDAGRNIAAGCTTCHGADGRSPGAIPSLAGRDKAEIVAAMKAFRDGTRRSTVMQQLARGYSDAQIEAAAAYFAAQKAAR
jgi:cytochrome c553